MLIGARSGMLSGGWKNPYITDGLVAMWDVEWNIGGASTLKDLVGSNDIMLYGTTVGPNYIQFDGIDDYATFASSSSFNYGKNITLEFVELDNTFGNKIFLAANQVAFNVINTGNRVSLATRNNSENQIQYRLTTFTKVPHLFSIYYDQDNLAVSLKEDNLELDTTTYGSYTAHNKGPMLGCRQYNSTRAYFFDGRMYTMRIYNRQLLSSEREHNYSIDKVRFNLP